MYDLIKGSRPVRKVQFFFNIVQKAFDPPPFRLNIMWWIFFEGILTKVRKNACRNNYRQNNM